MTISTVQYNSRTHQAMSGGQDGVYAQCTRTRMLCLTRLQSDCVCGAIVNQRTRWPVLQWRNRTIGASNTSSAWRCPPIDRHGLHHLTHQLNHETCCDVHFLLFFGSDGAAARFLSAAGGAGRFLSSPPPHLRRSDCSASFSSSSQSFSSSSEPLSSSAERCKHQNTQTHNHTCRTLVIAAAIIVFHHVLIELRLARRALGLEVFRSALALRTALATATTAAAFGLLRRRSLKKRPPVNRARDT